MEKSNDITPLGNQIINIDKVGPEGKFVEFDKDQNGDYRFKTKGFHPYQTDALHCETLTLRMKIDALYNMKKYLLMHINREIEIILQKEKEKLFKEKYKEYGIHSMENRLNSMQDSLEDA